MEKRRQEGLWRVLAPLRAMFAKPDAERDVVASLRQYLETGCRQLTGPGIGAADFAVFHEHLRTLFQMEHGGLRQVAMTWLLADFIRHHRLPQALHEPVLSDMRQWRDPWLAPLLLQWLTMGDTRYADTIISWLGTLAYEDGAQKAPVIQTLLKGFLVEPTVSPIRWQVLLDLDQPEGLVADALLNAFPDPSTAVNLRMIALMGETGRIRILKPLIQYAQEYPEALQPVMKALRRFQLDEVDRFFLSCLDKRFETRPTILIEAIKQVRARRLRKAIPLLEAMFPVEANTVALVNQAINSEIALSMASFGAYIWARDKLLPQMLLEGINPKLLKAIDRLNLEEAVPILKAILLAPEAPGLQVLQQQAFAICSRLLARNRDVIQSPPL